MNDSTVKIVFRMFKLWDHIWEESLKQSEHFGSSSFAVMTFQVRPEALTICV